MERSMADMRVLKLSFQFTAFIMMFIFMACTSTSTNFFTLWKDETYQVRPQKILVISAFHNPATRWTFEDELVRALKNRGIDAVMSYTVMPDMPDSVLEDKGVIAAKAMEAGADTVLIDGPFGRTTDEFMDASGVTHLDIHIKTQTEIFDMKSNRLIMSASAETWVRNGMPYTILVQSYVKELVNKLSQLGVF
jgi:hypothetical protein